MPATDLALGPLAGGPVTRLEVDLTCDATSPVWGRGMRIDTTTMNEDDKNPAISGSGLHLEQSIKVTGTVRFDDYTATLDAVGPHHSCTARSNQWRGGPMPSFPSGRTFHGLNVWVVG